MVEVALPGQRWEIEFFVDGTVEIERFESAAAGVELITVDSLKREPDAWK